MANQFEIPGLKDAIENIKNLTTSTEKLSKDLLDAAVSAEKVMKSFNGTGMKDYVEMTKKSNETQKETKDIADKLVQAEQKLAFAKTDLAKQISAVNLQTQQQNQINKASAQIIDLNSESLRKEVTSIAEARAQNALLTQARNNVNLTTAEGQLQLTGFNAKLDANNAFIKANADAALKQKMNIGDYAGGVKSALEQTGLFSGKIGELTRTAVGFVQGGAQAVTKVKDISESVVTGAKNTASYVAAKIKMIAVEKSAVVAVEASTIATEANAVATAESRVVVAGFSTAATVATTATEGMAVAQVGLAGTTEVAAGAEVAATATTWGLNAALAVLLFPITAVVLAFGVLVYIFKDFAPVINPVKDLFASLMAIFEVLKSSVFALATGSKSLTEVFSSLGSETSKAAEEAYKLAKAQREIIASERALELSSAKAQAEITKLITQSKNRTLSEEERMKMLKKAIDLENENVAAKLSHNNKEMAAARMRLSEGKEISEEDMKQLAKGNANYAQEIKKKYNLDQSEIDHLRKIQVERYGLIEASSRVVEKANNFSDRLADAKEKKEEKAKEKAEKDAEKANADAEKAAEKELSRQKKTAEETVKTMKITLDNQIASYDQASKLESENIAHIQATSEMKRSIASAELSKNLIGVKKGSQDELILRNTFSQELVKIETERNKALEKTRLDGAKFELEVYDMNNKTLIKDGATLTDLLVNEEKKRIAETMEVHRAGLRDELNIDKTKTDEQLKIDSKTKGLLTANELKYLQGIKKLEDDKNKDTKKVDADLLASKVKEINDEVKLEEGKFKLLNKGSLAQSINSFKLKQAALNKELNLVKGDAKKKAEIEKQLADNVIAMNEATAASKKKNLEDGFAFFIEISGKSSAVGKALAIAQIGYNTYEGASKLFIAGAEATAEATAHAAAFDPIGAAMYASAATQAYIQGGLVIANGAMSASKIAGFEVGTNYAPYTGLAMIDEKGAEIHTDAFGNIKSFGSDSGAHLTNITKGDKILPADISAMVRSAMFSSSRIDGHIKSNKIDYDKIEQGFGRQMAKANNNKSVKSYVVIDNKLVEIVNKGSITMKNYSDNRNNSFKRQNLS